MSQVESFTSSHLTDNKNPKSLQKYLYPFTLDGIDYRLITKLKCSKKQDLVINSSRVAMRHYNLAMFSHVSRQAYRFTLSLKPVWQIKRKGNSVLYWGERRAKHHIKRWKYSPSSPKSRLICYAVFMTTKALDWVRVPQPKADNLDIYKLRTLIWNCLKYKG